MRSDPAAGPGAGRPEVAGEGRPTPALPEHGPDAVVVAAIVGGDERVFADLVRRLSPAMLRVATSYVGSRAVAEEVVQEAWVSVFRGIAAYEGRSSLRTWVFRICVHGEIRRSGSERRSQPFTEAFADDGPTVDPARFNRADARDSPRAWSSPPHSWRELPDERLLAAETRSVVARTVDELPERQRLVVVLRDVEGYTSEEVCQILDISEGNQRVLLHRARARLRTALEHYLEAT